MPARTPACGGGRQTPSRANRRGRHHRPTQRIFERAQPRMDQRSACTCAASGSSHSNSEDGESASKEEKAALQQRLADQRLYHSQDPDGIGAEYGQGFEMFTARDEPTRLGVDELNEKLAVKGRLRLRHAHKPDEGYGAIFCFDGVICNTRQIKKEAWQAVAKQRGLRWPELERPQMYGMGAERAALDVLRWTQDMREARKIAHDVAAEFAQRFQSLQQADAGVAEWLQALAAARVPCAVTTGFERVALNDTLDRLGLREYFQATVTAEDGMETRSQQLLSACIKLGRPPNQCIAFVSDTRAITAAHNATLRAVAVAGVHAGHQLRTADLTCVTLAELTVYNLRRLFANAGEQMMDLRKVHGHGSKPGHKRPQAVGSVEPS